MYKFILQDLMQDGSFTSKNNLLEMYNNFISEFEHRINPVSLVEIVLPTSRTIQSPAETVKFLEKINETVKVFLKSLYPYQTNWRQHKRADGFESLGEGCVCQILLVRKIFSNNHRSHKMQIKLIAPLLKKKHC